MADESKVNALLADETVQALSALEPVPLDPKKCAAGPFARPLPSRASSRASPRAAAALDSSAPPRRLVVEALDKAGGDMDTAREKIVEMVADTSRKS